MKRLKMIKPKLIEIFTFRYQLGRFRKLCGKSGFLISLIFLLISPSLSAQNLTITGKVTDAKTGETIVGANITIKGTSQGTITDVNGVYSIQAQSGSTLVVSFIGYLSEEKPVTGSGAIDIALSQDLIGLDEVVVVGYGSMKKADLTGSVSVVNKGDLVKTAAPNLTNTLAGKMTGIIARQVSGRPGDDNASTFLIRGKSTFDPNNRGTNNPLILVDGIERDFNRIDPNDIESITVLKDAASAAIYGSRGANGVILVTTKRGSDSKPQITFNTSHSWQSPTFRPEYMNAGEYAKYINEAYENDGMADKFTDKEVQQYEDGTLPGTDWWGQMMSKSAPISQFDLSATGGNDRTVYYLSLGYLNQGGLFSMANYERYNIRSNIDTKVTKNLKVSLDISVRKDDKENTPIGEDKLYQTLQTAIPTIPAYVPESLRVPGDDLGLNYNGTAGSPMGESMYSGYIRDNNYYIENKLGLNYDIPFVEGLAFKVDYAYDLQFLNNKNWSEPYTLNFYTLDAGLIQSGPSQSLTSLSQKNENRKRSTLQGGFNYNRTFGPHNLSSLLMFEQMDYFADPISGYREGYLATNLQYLYAGGTTNMSNDGKPAEDALQAFVYRLAYNYNQKYLFQLNMRYNGSMNFPKGNKWGLFSGVSAGWRISEESFMKNMDVISNLKLRASYGEFGNDRIANGQYLSGYQIYGGYVIGDTYYTGVQDTGIPNKNLEWEKANNSDFGLDFGLFQGKISGEFDYFYKRTTGILITRSASVPQTFGSALPDENLGKVDNKGVEGVLRYQESKGDFHYQIAGNLTFAKSKIIYMDEAINTPDRLKKTGNPFDGKYGWTAVGLFQTQDEIDASPVQDGSKNSTLKPGDIKYFDLNADGVIDENDEQLIGKSNDPELIFGLNLDLTYKNWGLNINFQGASGYSRYNFLSSFEKDYNSYKVLEDSWRPGNENAKYPRLEANGRSANNSRYSTFWLNDGFYIKMRNIQLSYTLSKKPYLDKVGINSLSIYASGRNLLTFAKKDGFDPEGTNNRYPIMATTSIGLNVTF